MMSFPGPILQVAGDPAASPDVAPVPPLPGPVGFDPRVLLDGRLLPVLAGLGVVLLAASLGAYLLRRLRRRAAPVRTEFAERPPIAVEGLAVPALPASVARVEVHGVPAQLVAVVLAPRGRGQTLPPASDWPTVLATFFPRLDEVARRHGTAVVAWPAQLAQNAFDTVFFQEARLPGDHGRGTPWFGMTGRVDCLGRSVLVGALFRGDHPNPLAELRFAEEGHQRSALRIADATPPPPPTA